MKVILFAMAAHWENRLSELLLRRGYSLHVVTDVKQLAESPAVEQSSLAFVGVSDNIDKAVEICRILHNSRNNRLQIIACAYGINQDKVQTLVQSGASDFLFDSSNVPEIELRINLAESRFTLSSHSSKSSQIVIEESDKKKFARDISKGFFRSSLDGKFIDFNQVLVEMLGYESREELMQIDIKKDLYIDPSVRSQILAEPNTGDKVSQVLGKRRNGEPIALRANWRRVFSDNGEFLYFEGVVEDITQSLADSKLLKIQHELARKLSSIYDLKATLDEVLSAIMKVSDFDSSGIYFFNDATQNLELMSMVGGSPQFMQDMSLYPIKPHIAQYMTQGKSLCFNTGDTRLTKQDAFKKAGMQAVGIVPVSHQGRLIGALGIGSRTVQHFSDSVRQGIEVIAAQVGGTIARVQAEAIKQANQKNLQSLFDTLKDMVVVLDHTGQLMYANRMVSDSLGYTPEELSEMTVGDLHPPHRKQEAQAAFSNILAGRSSICEIPYSTKHGTEIPVETYVAKGKWGIVDAVFGITRDLTERHLSRLALKESESRFRAIFENAAIGLVLADLNGTFLAVNNAFSDMLGYEADELIGKSFYEVTPPDEYETQETFVNELITGKRAKFLWEKKYLHKSGSIVWGRLNVSVLRNDEGTPLYAIGIIENVTKRKIAEERLQDNEALFQGLFDNLPDLVILADSNAKIIYANHNPFSDTKEEMTGTVGYTFIDEADHKKCQEAFSKTLATGITQTVETRDLSGRIWLCKLVKYVNLEGKQHVLIICTDITEQKQALEVIQKEQHLLRNIIDIHERDRQIIAYEIHDGVAQQITGSLLHLEAFRRLRGSDVSAAEKSLDISLKLISQSVNDVRQIISGLRPLILDEYGIIEAIEYLVCENSESSGMQISFNHDVHFKRLTPPLENAVFRIAQEALKNACRHSNSNQVVLSLNDKADKLYIKVTDNGVGFDPNTVEETHFGLRGIRERTRLLGGKAIINSSIGSGTCVSVELPIVIQAEEND